MQNKSTCKQMIMLSKVAGADYAKIQKRNPDICVPEHQKNIIHVVNKAIKDASIVIDDIDGIAVTYGAGLKGALLVGLNFAKGMSIALNIPFIGINHDFYNGRFGLELRNYFNLLYFDVEDNDYEKMVTTQQLLLRLYI